MRPCHVYATLEELKNSSSAPMSRNGCILSDADSQTVKEAYQQWLALLIDIGYLPPDGFIRTARRLWTDMVRVDVYVLLESMTECLQSVRLQTCSGFKAHCLKVSTHLYPLIKDDVVLSCEGDVFSAKRLIQLFSYLSRLSLQDIDLTDSQLKSYLEIEDNMPHIHESPFVLSLNKIMREWIGPYCPEEPLPQHGPGGVAYHGRSASIEVKYKDLTTDGLLRYAFGEPWWIVGPFRSVMERMSKTIFVAKSWKSFRTISMEPSTLQFFQQGIWKVIDSQVGRNSYLRNHIGFHEQERNRTLAREGSLKRNYATLDLSSASDSVSYELVKAIFKGTWLLRYLVATRSRKSLLPNGQIVDLRKFAPMGSALCFPVETLVFASVCEHVTRVRGVAGHWSVFGDDIIVPSASADVVMRSLQTLGFYVNNAKSFVAESCWFRESCGGEYCNGFDVTPMKISRKYASQERDVRLKKLIELANTAFKYGFRNLRYFFIQKLRKSNYVPLFAPTSLLSDNYTNYHTERRWNRSLQRIDVKVTDLTSKSDEKLLSKQDEAIRYLHWLITTADRKSVGLGFQSVICKSTASIHQTWMSKPYELSDQEFVANHSGQLPPQA